MTNHNPAQERQQLAQYYAELPDESLQELAKDMASLTEIAREVLTAEIGRRNLTEGPEPQVESTGQSPASDADGGELVEKPDERDGLVTIRQFRDLAPALLAKGALDSAGIRCFLIDTNMVRLDWFISNLLGGIKLQVEAEDAEAATEILNQSIPDGFDVEGFGSYEQPRCPKCDSVDITFEALNKPIAYSTALFGLPLPISSNVWKCESCGQRWEESDDAPAVDGRTSSH